MHSLVRRYIKTAIGFLALGLLVGGWMVVRRELLGIFPSTYEVSAHTHAILVGFVMMMILGVALWLFPRPDKTDAQYSPGIANVAWWMLTIATAVRMFCELARPHVAHTSVRWAVTGASLAQILGLGLFFYTMWPRIRAVGSHVREQKGERF